MANETERPTIKVQGTEISEERYSDLKSAVVEQSVLVPDMFTLTFYDPTLEIFDAGTFKIGAEVEISYSDEDEETVVTKGDVTAVSVESSPSGLHELVVSGLGKGHKLARGAKVKVYKEVTDGDVVSQIAGEHGLTAVKDATSTTYPWLVQDQDDFAFLTERARMIGFEWWVTESKLYFKKLAKDGSSPTVKWPDDLFNFKIRFSAAEAITEATVRGWDPIKQQAFEGKSNVTVAADDLGSDAPAAAAANNDMKAMATKDFAGISTAHDAVEAKALADSLVRRGVADEVDARGVTIGNPKMKAGTALQIAGLGDNLSGKYTLTSVDHVYRSGERYVTRFRAGGRQPKSLVDLLGNRMNQASDLGQRLLAGVVTDTADPDNAGRVKVNFPTLGDDAPSDWARLCAPGGGDKRGLIVYPEIGDEVLVGFEDGDPRRPLILGGLWSKKLLPPETGNVAIKNKKVVTKGFHSRGGHTFVLSDGESPSEKSVAIDLSDGQTALYLGEDKVTLDSPKTITVTGGQDITIKADTSGVTISANTIKIQAKTDLTLEGTNVSIKGKAGVTIEGAKTDVKAQGMLNLEAGGIASVKGSLLKLN